MLIITVLTYILTFGVSSYKLKSTLIQGLERSRKTWLVLVVTGSNMSRTPMPGRAASARPVADFSATPEHQEASLRL